MDEQYVRVHQDQVSPPLYTISIERVLGGVTTILYQDTMSVVLGDIATSLVAPALAFLVKFNHLSPTVVLPAPYVKWELLTTTPD